MYHDHDEKGGFEEAVNFMKGNPGWVVADPYEVYGIYLLSDRPPKVDRSKIKGFGEYCNGTSLILEDMPSRILIIGQND